MITKIYFQPTVKFSTFRFARAVLGKYGKDFAWAMRAGVYLSIATFGLFNPFAANAPVPNSPCLRVEADNNWMFCDFEVDGHPAYIGSLHLERKGF